MRFLVCVAALAAVAAAAHTGRGQYENTIPELFHGQREYVYNYRSLVGTGLTTQSTRYSGLEKFGVLTVQVQEQHGDYKVLGLRLGHVMTGSFDKEVEDIENRRIEGLAHSSDETIERHGPVFVKYQGNEVQQIQTPQGMPEEIVNIYRGIAAALTVGKPHPHGGAQNLFAYEGEQGEHGQHGQPIVYRRHEHGIAGNFETTYEILSNPEQYGHLNVTKTRNYMKHVGRDGRYFHNGHDERGCHNVCPTHKPEQIERTMQPEPFGWEGPVTEGCPVKFHPKSELVQTYTTYGYNMTVEQGGKLGLIHDVRAIDKKVLPLRQQQIMTVSVLKLTFNQQRPISQLWDKKDATKQYEDLTFRLPEGHKFDLGYLALYGKQNNGDMLRDQVVPMIKALSEIIVSDNIELRGTTGDKIVQLAQAIGVLDKQGLQTIWGHLGEPVSGKTGTDLEKVQRKVLVDIMGLSGSNDAAEFLVELIQQQKLSTLETVHTFETLQKNIVKPTTKIMNLLLGVCTDAKFQEKRTIFSTACIAYAEIVRGNCGGHKHTQWQNQQPQRQQEGQYEHVQFCGEQEYVRFVDTIIEKLNGANDFAQHTVYIQTLGRLGHPKGIKALFPYVYGEQQAFLHFKDRTGKDQNEDISEYTHFIRQVAIYALHHTVKEHGAAVQPIVQGIYFNQEENYEIRIAALSVLLATQPTEATFGRIVIELGREHNLEVASYAYSALRSIANSTIPCMRQSARRVQNVLGGLPQKTFGLHRSKWYTYSQYYPLANMGLKGHWEVTQSNVSAVPRAFFAGFTANKGPFVSTVGNFGFFAKGFENLDKFILHQGGMNKIVENVIQRVRRDARTYSGDESVEKMLEHIEEAMHFNVKENNEQPRAVVFGNVLGNELYLPVDKEYVTKVAKKAGERIINLIREQGTEKTFRYVRVLMPRTYVQVAPGVNGMPVVLVNRHPIVVSFALKDLQTRFGAEKGQLKLHPFVFAASGLIRPTVYHTSIHTAKVINPVGHVRLAHGVIAYEQTYFTLPVDAAVQYTHQTNTVAFTLRPRFEKVFFHKTRVMTFKTEALVIRPVDKPLLEQYTLLKTQQQPFTFDRVFGEKLGMALRVQGISMNEEYAVNFLRNRLAREQNPMVAFVKEVTNQWFFPRTWSVRVEQSEQKPIQEVKLVLRVGNLLKERMHHENTQQLKQQHLTQEQLTKEQAYPEFMRMIAYEQEFEKITGRKPETERLEQAVERIAKKTEKYWGQVDRELQQKLNKVNTQARSVEYILSTKGEKVQPITITGHVIVASTPTKQVKLGEIKMNVEKHPISFEAQGVTAYTKAPQPFETEVREQEQQGIVGFVAELETRQTGKQQYSGKIEMTKSEEQKNLMKLPVEQKPWYYHQCEEDKKEHKSEMSTACEYTRLHKSALNKLTFEIELPQQIHERLLNVAHKMRETLKVHLYRNLRANYYGNNNNQNLNKIEGEVIYSERYPEMRMANLTLRTPDQEELRFERVALPKALRPNNMWSLKQQVKALLRNGRPEPVCIYNGHYLRTFDNVTVPLEAMKQGKTYVITRDNDEDSKFTILAKRTQGGQQGQTELEILLRGVTFIKLTPTTQQGHYKVHVNHTEIDVTTTETKVEQYGRYGKNMITFHVEEHNEGQDTLVVKVRDMRMRVVYDGQNFKIELGKRQLKGQLTGLCGDMNNEYEHELTGPRGCRYEREQDFVRAFGLNHEQGQMGKWTCPEGVYPRGATNEEIAKHQQYRTLVAEQQDLSDRQRHSQMRGGEGRLTKETKFIILNGQVCFSIEPVSACPHGEYQVSSEMRSIPFTCLKPDDPRVAQIEREIQLHDIAQNLPKPLHGNTVYRVEIPTRCQ